MKFTKLLTLILFLLYSSTIFGQKNSYNDLKKTYNRSDFSLLTEPKYNPGVAALKSFALPGLGQYYLDEPKLGSKDIIGSIIIDGAALASIALIINAHTSLLNEYVSDADILAMIGLEYLKIWVPMTLVLRYLSSSNAKQIARIKSVAFDDMKNKSLSLKVFPEIKYHTVNSNTSSLIYGLNLTYNF